MAKRGENKTGYSQEEEGRHHKDLSESEIVHVINSYLRESEEERKKRFPVNRRNLDAYLSIHGEDDEEEGDNESGLYANEFIPRTFVAVERLSKFIIKALSDVGSKYFSIDVPKDSNLDPEGARSLMMCFLHEIGEGGESFFDVLEDAIKYGLLTGEMIAKVYGTFTRKVSHIPLQILDIEEQVSQDRFFRPVVSIIDPDKYFPDPTGAGLYEIHKVMVDAHILMEMAEEGFYDKEAVKKVVFGSGDEGPPGRRPIEIIEMYGDILGKRGMVAYRNSIATIADEKLIRKVTPNPYWHGMSPFVRVPFTRVPNGKVGAIFDPVVDANIAMNRLFNLMLDGAVGSVKGIKLVRLGYLENPHQVMGGIRDGDEIHVRADVPFGAKPIDFQKMGEIPPEAFNMFAVLDRILTEAGLLTDIAIGRPPPKEATATEIIQLTQSQSYLLNGLILAVERFISEVLKRVWMLCMQYLEFMDPRDIVSSLGINKASEISNMSPSERYEAFSGCGFRVTGLTEFVRKTQDLQALSGLVAAWLSNPVMARVFLMRFDMFKILNAWSRLSGIDVSDLVYPEDVQAQMEQMAVLGSSGGNLGEEQSQQTPKSSQYVSSNIPKTG